MKLNQALRTVALLSFSVATAYGQHAKDIVGVTLGMSFDEVKAKLGPGYAFQKPTNPDPAVSYLIAYKANQDVWSLEAINGRLVYIQHKQVFRVGSQPLAFDLWNQLTAKYGKEPGVGQYVVHEMQRGSPQGLYIYDQSGAPLPWRPTGPIGNPRYCEISTGDGLMVVNADRIGFFPARLTPGCHQILSFYIPNDQQYAAALTVSILDEDAMVRESQHLKEGKSAEDQRKEDTARKVKVPM